MSSTVLTVTLTAPKISPLSAAVARRQRERTRPQPSVVYPAIIDGTYQSERPQDGNSEQPRVPVPSVRRVQRYWLEVFDLIGTKVPPWAPPSGATFAC